VNQAVSNDLNTIVIGKNVGWKQDINIGKKNNQTFTQIPFDLLIKLISYKAKLKGINIILQEESYTSKVSFFDNDYIPTYGTDDDKLNASGKRIKRGLYKTKTSALINADVNGSLNILRKYLKASSDQIINVGSRGFVTNPLVVNI
jgi:putative transposase